MSSHAAELGDEAGLAERAAPRDSPDRASSERQVPAGHWLPGRLVLWNQFELLIRPPRPCPGRGLRVMLTVVRHQATLALQAKVETKVVSDTLGHSTTRITEDLYQHVSVQMQIGAAETVVALLPERKARGTGS